MIEDMGTLRDSLKSFLFSGCKKNPFTLVFVKQTRLSEGIIFLHEVDRSLKRWKGNLEQFTGLMLSLDDT